MIVERSLEREYLFPERPEEIFRKEEAVAVSVEGEFQRGHPVFAAVRHERSADFGVLAFSPSAFSAFCVTVLSGLVHEFPRQFERYPVTVDRFLRLMLNKTTRQGESLGGGIPAKDIRRLVFKKPVILLNFKRDR